MPIRRRTAGAILALTLAGSAGAVAAAVPASAAPNPDSVVAACQFVNQLNPGFFGGCVSYINSGGDTGAYFAYLCKAYDVPFGEFSNVGECVSAFTSIYGG